MKKFFKIIIGCLFFTLIVVNVFTASVKSSEEVSLFSLKTGIAKSECEDDERNVQVNCTLTCPGGWVAAGKMIICRSGEIDCSPTECDADCSPGT